MLKRLLVVAVLVSFAAVPVAFAQAPAQVKKGQQVYAAQKCAICHSIAGVGNKNGVLDGVGTKLSADDTRQWIVDAPGMTAKTKSTRKPLMRAYASLAKDELDALVAYMQSLKK